MDRYDCPTLKVKVKSTKLIPVLRLGTELRLIMNSTKCLLALTTIALVFASLTWAADDKDESDINKRIDASARVLNEVIATPDKTIPVSIMSDARCIAVVASMIKIAIGNGRNHGKGVATWRGS